VKFIKSKTGITLLCLLLVAFLGAVDYITGYEVSFSIFYLTPVCLANLMQLQKITNAFRRNHPPVATADCH